MKRFRFSLRPVAILRGHHELRAREAFATAVQAFVKAEQDLADARARLRGIELAMAARRQAHFSGADEAQAIFAYQRECEAEVAAVKGVADARAVMQAKRDEYIEAHRKLEVVKRLEEKARLNHRLAAGREEQAEFDDYAGRSFARRAQNSV